MKKNKTDYIIISIAIFVFCIISCMVLLYKPLGGFEEEYIKSFQSIMSVLPQAIPIFLADFGYYIFGCSIFGLSLIYLLFQKLYKTSFIFLTLICSVFKASELIKSLFNRPRPDINIRLVDVMGTSFPSGHSFVNACISAFMIYIVFKYVKTKMLKQILIPFFVCWIIIVGLSRIWLGVHHPTDIIGGYCAGILYAYIFILLDKKLTQS